MKQMESMESSRKKLEGQLEKLLYLKEEEKNQDRKMYDATVQSIKNILAALDKKLLQPMKAPKQEEGCCDEGCCHPICECNVDDEVFFATAYTVPREFEWDTTKFVYGSYITEAGIVVNTEYLKVVPEICYKEDVSVQDPCDETRLITGCKAKIKGLRVLGHIPYGVEVKNLINPSNFSIDVSNPWWYPNVTVGPVVSPSHFTCTHVDNLIKYTAECNYVPDIKVKLTEFMGYMQNEGVAYEVMIFGVFKITV